MFEKTSVQFQRGTSHDFVRAMISQARASTIRNDVSH